MKLESLFTQYLKFFNLLILAFKIFQFTFKGQNGDMWIGIVSDGSISCQGLDECDGKKLWIDGTNFDKTLFTDILDINIQAGHRY